MHVERLRIQNYKSYRDSGYLELDRGVNIIVGQNNSGKTALLDALSLRCSSRPHLSLESHPTRRTPIIGQSFVDIVLVLEREELLDLLLIPNTDFHIPVPDTEEDQTRFLSTDGDGESRFRGLVEKVLEQDRYRFYLRYCDGGFVADPPYSLKLYEPKRQGSNLECVNVRVRPDRSYEVAGNSGQVSPNSTADLGVRLATTLRDRIYAFRAERFNISSSAFGSNTTLAPNATNLPEVLHNLQSNKHRFNRFNDLAQRVLPQIRHISVVSRDNQNVEIRVWNEETETEREDLAIPLGECGTGIGQVLAMLYVVVNSDSPQVIVIDEPQSFLHPSAVRKLMEVLRAHPQHQYILATHSSTAVAAAEPRTVTLLQKRGAATCFQAIDPKQHQDLRQYLLEIGARLSDIFGADSILWVEGLTEELCFPMVITELLRRPLKGTAILGVRNTGDLEGEHAKAVFEIYTRLSKGAGLLPPAIGFVFDPEGRSQKERDDIVRQSSSDVAFLPRRLYENYLLNPSAITAVANSVEGFSEHAIQVADVTKWLDEARAEPKFYRDSAINWSPDDPNWQYNIHGARVLERLFVHLSETRVQYVKTTHSVELTRWLINHSPDDFQELAAFLGQVLDRGERRLSDHLR